MKKKNKGLRNPILIYALALFGAGLEAMSGSVNGWTFSRNKGGAYVRYKASPVQPRTPFQVNVRGLLTSFSQAWRALTQVQRDGWINLSKNLPYTNVFGQTKYISGSALFNKFNINITHIGSAPIDDAPTPESPIGITAISPAANSGAASFAVNMTYSRSAGGDDAVLVFATPPFSPGKKFVQNQFRLIGSFNGTPAGSLDIYTMWNSRFGLLISGQNVAVRMVPALNTTGQVGLGQQQVVAIT